MTDAPAASIYELTAKPPEEITDEDLELIIANFRERRKIYLTGKPDKRPAKGSKAAPVTAQDKADNTAAIMAELDLKLNL